ncbi:MAG: M20 family metallopeptidase, partial [Thermomicrobiales bacterium]
MTTDPSFSEADARRVLDAIDEREVVDFLRCLIQIPTVNPPGDVREAILLCSAPLNDVGFDLHIVALEETKPNLVALLGRGGPTLCFNAHVDVVPTGEKGAWSHAPFGAEIVDRRVYG